MRRSWLRIAGSGAIFATFLVVVACKAPTQAALLLKTTLRCSEITSAAITVASRPLHAEADFKAHDFAAEAPRCEGGTIGTLLIEPSTPRGAAMVVVGVKSLLGEGKTVRDCAPPKYAGCIVQRRQFTFVDAETMRIPILLDPTCIDVPCEAVSTCKNGRCVSAEVVCGGGDCETVEGDGGAAPDASQPGDGSDDGATEAEASMSSDASDSAPQDATDGNVGSDGGGPFNNFCGGGSYCDEPCGGGSYCCRNTSGSPSTCREAGACDFMFERVSCCDGTCPLTGPTRLYCSRLFTDPIGAFQCRVPMLTDAVYYCRRASDCPPDRPNCMPNGVGPVGMCIP